jgi:hypothetical protein
MPRVVLDLRGLAPPEPLERMLAALATLGPGDCVHARFPREPLLLYPLLEQHGFEQLTHAASSDDVHVVAWRRRDADAAGAARALAASLGHPAGSA